jgi:hypothetical protein
MSIEDQINNHKTCEQRIYEHFRDREQYVYEMFEACNNNTEFDGYDDPYDAVHNYPMGLSYYKVVKIELSWGGPSDYYKAFFDDEGALLWVDYHFADWFDHAQMRVPETSPIYEYIEQYIQPDNR